MKRYLYKRLFSTNYLLRNSYLITKVRVWSTWNVCLSSVVQLFQDMCIWDCRLEKLQSIILLHPAVAIIRWTTQKIFRNHILWRSWIYSIMYIELKYHVISDLFWQCELFSDSFTFFGVWDFRSDQQLRWFNKSCPC